MKKFLVILVLMFTSVISNAQLKSNVIYKSVDEMDGSYTFFIKDACITSNPINAISFEMKPFISKDVNFEQIVGKIVGINECKGKYELILLFDGGSRVIMQSTGKPNCYGAVTFNITNRDYEVFKTKRLLKLRLTNKRTHESFTQKVEVNDYYINIIKLMESGVFNVLVQ